MSFVAVRTQSSQSKVQSTKYTVHSPNSCTNANIDSHSIHPTLHNRCIRYGHFDLSHALVERQVGLESVIENISALGRVLNEKGALRRSRHFQKDNDDGAGEKQTFGDFLSKEDLNR